MKKTLPLVGILIVVALVPSIIGALIGTKGTGTFVIDFLLFGPILPIIILFIILWLLGKQPLEPTHPTEETAPPEPIVEEKPSEEPMEPEIEEVADKETSEEIEAVCPTCGAKVSLEEEYCPHCGAEFEDETDKESPDSGENEIESTKKEKKK